MNKAKVEEGYQMILDGLGIAWEKDPHMRDTPFRAAKAMVNELCVGLFNDPPKMTVFPNTGTSNMIVSKGVPVRSLCAHHLLPFIGTATVAYIPKDFVVGLSKMSRVVEHCSRKPQVQEDLTNEIADVLSKSLFQKVDGDVAVVVRSRHMCMEYRGVTHDSDVITSSLRGEFMAAEVRAEFLSFVDRV